MFARQVAKPQTKAAANPTSKLAHQRSTLAAQPFGGGAVERAHLVKPGISNQPPLGLLAPRATSLTGNEPHGHNGREADPESLIARGATPGVAWDFSKIAIFPPDRADRPQ